MAILRPCPICHSPMVNIDLDGRMPKLTCPGCGRSVSASTIGACCSMWDGRMRGIFPDVDVLPCLRCGSGRLRLRMSPPMVSCLNCGRLRDAFSQELCLDMWNRRMV